MQEIEHIITSVVFFPQIYDLSVIMRQTRNKEHSTKQLTSILQKCQGHVSQDRTEEMSQIGADQRALIGLTSMRFSRSVVYSFFIDHLTIFIILVGQLQCVRHHVTL